MKHVAALALGLAAGASRAAAQEAGAAAAPVAGLQARFAVWRPKDELHAKFEEGYRQHLQWHRTHADPWSWYGWLVVSGPRRGTFVDATFGHAPADFDHAVAPAADAADNALHTVPFATLQESFTVAQLPDASSAGPPRLAAPFLRAYYLTARNAAAAKPLLAKLRTVAAQKFPAQPLYCYQWLDGGQLPQFLVLLPFASYADSGALSLVLDELAALDARGVVQSIQAETLRYRADLSYFPGVPPAAK